jgi:hypothetical protein
VLLSNGIGVAPVWGQVPLAGTSQAVTGVLPIANGGTNSNATPTAGGVGYGTGTAHAYSAAGTSGQVLTSAGTSAPSWSSLSSITVTSITAGSGISASASTGAITISNTGVTSAVAGTGISVSGSTGSVTITNSGVTSITAGTGIGVSGSTGGVTITNNGVTSFSAGTTGFTPSTGTTGAVTLSGTLVVANGGTGVTTTPAAGQLLIGNGTNYTVANLTAGGGIGIANGSGSITISNSGVTSISAGSGISVTSSTGSITITNGGVTSAVAGTGVSVSASTGAVTFSIAQAVTTSSSVQFGSFGVGTAASGTTGEIRATNNVTAYYSDDRLKTRIGLIENPLNKVKSLNGFYYQANEIAKSLGYEVKKEVGISAQDVQSIMPEVVAPAPIDDKYLTVRYERLIPLLIEAIKELSAQVDELKGK